MRDPGPLWFTLFSRGRTQADIRYTRIRTVVRVDNGCSDLEEGDPVPTNSPPGRIVLERVVLPAAVSALTALLVVLGLGVLDREPAAHVEGSEATRGARLPDETIAAKVEQTRRELAELRRAVAGAAERRAAAPDDGANASVEALVGRIDRLERGQRLAIEEFLRELTRTGDGAVSGILSRLRAGDLRNWGGGIARRGTVIQGYPGQRLILMDALRQIGTPTAKKGLLNLCRESGRLDDCVSLFVLYGSSRDSEMIQDISNLIPGFLATLKRSELGDDDEIGMAIGEMGNWLRKHGATGLDDPLLDLVARAFRGGALGAIETLLQPLVDSCPERLAELMRSLHSENPKAQLFPLYAGHLWSGVPRAQSVRVYEILLKDDDLDAMIRRELYAATDTSACRAIESAEGRLEDLGVLRAFLSRRMALETDEGAREELEGVYKRLLKAIERGKK
jgi:hypothetical protein